MGFIQAEGSTADIKDLAGIAGMAPAMQTQSGSSQHTCLTDRAGWSHCLATQNVSVSHQPQHVLSLLISNIPGRVSWKDYTVFSPCPLPSSPKETCLVLSGCSLADPGKESASFPFRLPLYQKGFLSAGQSVWPWLNGHTASHPCSIASEVVSLMCSSGMETEHSIYSRSQNSLFPAQDWRVDFPALCGHKGQITELFCLQKQGELPVLSPIFCVPWLLSLRAVCTAGTFSTQHSEGQIMKWWKLAQ